MFRPSGAQPRGTTSNPSSANSRGASTVVAPLAQSTASRNPPSACAPGSAARACARYRGEKSRSSSDAASPSGTVHDVGHDLLDFGLEPLRELLASAREHLDAVVLERVVGRGDHHPSVELALAREVGDGRGGDHARAGYEASRRPGAVRELAANPLARFTRVTPDQQAVLHRRAGQRADEGGAKPADGADVEGRRPGAAAHAVCSEESFCHRCVNQEPDINRGAACGKRRYWILTRTVAGSIRTTTKSCGGSTRTERLYWPGPRPARSTNAAIASGCMASTTSLGPRMATATAAGTAWADSPRPALRR